MIKINCQNCQKELSKKQVTKHNEFCSKGCATSFRQKLDDPNFFDLDRDSYSYIVGLIATDGNIDKKLKKITISLSDKELIDKLNPLFCSASRKIYESKPKTKNHNVNYSIISTNENAISALIKMGITPAKSKTLFMQNLQCLNLNSFVRGVFDGDGSVYISSRYKGKNYLGVSIASASKLFLEQIQSILVQNDIECNILSDSRENNSSFYLKIYKISSILKFRNFIYDNSELFLSRKKKVFCQ